MKMNRKKKIKLSVFGVLLILFGIFTYELLWGKLFPFAPVVIGFTNHEMPHSNIYVQDGAEFDDFERIDTLLPIVEQFHELEFLYKPKIFIFRDSSSFMQRSLSKARFCVYPNSRLFISPWALKEANEEIISLEIYLRHELSHSLLDQNAGLIQAYRYPQWLMEGIAVYSTNQMGTSFYPSKEETYNDIADGNFLPPLDFKTKREDNTTLHVKYPIAFMYSEFACIVDYLVLRFGKPKLLLFMTKLLNNSDNDEVFMEVYHVEFSTMIYDFKNHVVENVKQQPQ